MLEGRRDRREFHYEWGTVYRGNYVHFVFDYYEAPTTRWRWSTPSWPVSKWKQ